MECYTACYRCVHMSINASGVVIVTEPVVTLAMANSSLYCYGIYMRSLCYQQANDTVAT